jgi:hypothetical protein
MYASTLAAPFGAYLGAAPVYSDEEKRDRAELYADLYKRLRGVTLGPVAGVGPFNVFSEDMARGLATRAVDAMTTAKGSARTAITKGIAPYMIGLGLISVTALAVGVVALRRARRG